MKTKLNDGEGQQVMGFYDEVKPTQDGASWTTVNKAGADSSWRNGLEDWLRFFSPLSSRGMIGGAS